MGRILVLLLGLSYVAVLTPTPGRAEPLVFKYQIEHPSYGDIGTFTNTIIKNGLTIEVHTTVRVAVKFLGATLYRETSDRTESWHGHRLMTFRGVTDKDGKTFEVSGQAQGDHFVVNGPAGTFIAPADVQPPNPWSATCLKGDSMLSSVSGRVFTAHVIDRGEEVVTAAGQKFKAHKYEIDTDRPHTVWFDARGVPLQIQSTERGEPVRLVLTRYPDDAEAIAAVPPR